MREERLPIGVAMENELPHAKRNQGPRTVQADGRDRCLEERIDQAGVPLACSLESHRGHQAQQRLPLAPVHLGDPAEAGPEAHVHLVHGRVVAGEIGDRPERSPYLSEVERRGFRRLGGAAARSVHDDGVGLGIGPAQHFKGVSAGLTRRENRLDGPRLPGVDHHRADKYHIVQMDAAITRRGVRAEQEIRRLQGDLSEVERAGRHDAAVDDVLSEIGHRRGIETGLVHGSLDAR